MNSEYKDNWQETRERFSVWWKRKEMDRPVMIVISPRLQQARSNIQKTFVTEEERWTKLSDVIECSENYFGQTAFFGEALPHYWANLGAGSFGVFLGAIPVFAPDTVWYEPCIKDIEKAQLFLDHNSKWLNWSVEATRIAINRSKGRYLVSVPDLIENLDTLAALLGTEELLYNLADAPQEIHRLQKQLLDLWMKAYNIHYDLVKDESGWSSYAAFHVWGPGKTAKLQCDISAMLSSGMFNDLALPYIKEQCDYLDNSVYHLDGINAICHLDSLLKIDSLDCIQWTPGSGQPDGGDSCWDFLYKKILNAGKCIHALIDAGNAKDFVKRFGKSGVLIWVTVANEEEGRKLIEELTGW